MLESRSGIITSDSSKHGSSLRYSRSLSHIDAYVDGASIRAQSVCLMAKESGRDGKNCQDLIS